MKVAFTTSGETLNAPLDSRFGRARTRPLGDKWFKALEETARSEGGITNGIEFIEMPLRERQRLQKLLASSDFQVSYTTQ